MRERCIELRECCAGGDLFASVHHDLFRVCARSEYDVGGEDVGVDVAQVGRGARRYVFSLPGGEVILVSSPKRRG
jgi:hypothetical protein